MTKPTFVYVTYIATTLEKLWDSLTGEAFTQQYWESRPEDRLEDRPENEQIQSDWQPGSPIERTNLEGESERIGEVLHSEPPHRLVYSFQSADAIDLRPSRVRFELEQYGSSVKLTLIHDRLDTQSCMSVSRQWPVKLSYLKRLLEVEEILAIAA